MGGAKEAESGIESACIIEKDSVCAWEGENKLKRTSDGKGPTQSTTTLETENKQNLWIVAPTKFKGKPCFEIQICIWILSLYSVLS